MLNPAAAALSGQKPKPALMGAITRQQTVLNLPKQHAAQNQKGAMETASKNAKLTRKQPGHNLFFWGYAILSIVLIYTKDS